MKQCNKPIISIFIVAFLIINQSFSIYSAINSSILSEKVQNEYNAREIGESIINNIQFRDVASSNWAKEPITRLGAIGVFEGYSDKLYRPNNTVSNEEILTLLVRIIGMEENAIIAAEQIAQNNPSNEELASIWSKGHMKIANNIGLISNSEYSDALSPDQSSLKKDVNFIREDPVTREQVAKWLVDAINYKNPGQIVPIYDPQAILDYSDWKDIGISFVPYVEAIIRNKIMVGSGTSFNPKNNLRRDELAQVIINIDDILYDTMNIEKKSGIIDLIYDINSVNTSSNKSTKEFYIRNEQGAVDKLIYEKNSKNAPVFKNGQVVSMDSLYEGESIEYLIDKTSNEIIYIYDKNKSKEEMTGVLQPLVNLSKGEIAIVIDGNKKFTYKMASNIYDKSLKTIEINNSAYSLDKAPVGSQVTLKIQNNIITEINYSKQNYLSNEISGIVKENNITFSYITIIDWDGNEITKKYVKKDVIIEKQNYYDESDEIGYIDEMFPNFSFDERDSNINDIESGDVVHMKINDSNVEYVSMISAKTNYIVKYATIDKVSYNGASGTNLSVVFDDNSTFSYTLDNNIPVLKSGKNVGTSMIKSGNIVRMLVNQAVLSPGNVKETIKEIVIDQYGNEVANIYKGKLGRIDKVQRTMSVLNSYELSNIGWYNYSQTKVLDISENDIEYYEDGKQISLSYAEKYFNTDDCDMYIVTSDYYDVEKIEKISFRDGRDSVLDNSSIIYSNGINKIRLLNNSKNIAIDEGTIVVKNGRIVEEGNIVAPDYAQVVLNNNQAAVVYIEPENNNDAIGVYRGRIDAINEGQSFQVESHAVLMDMQWIYSPIPRIFNLSYKTKIYDENGLIPYNEFISYSDISKVDEVYTIIAEGTTAKYVVKNKYATEGVLGEIYEVNAKDIMIKDVLVYSDNSKKWTNLSYNNNYAMINLLENSIIIKNNDVIEKESLRIGDKIRIMTNEDLTENLKLNSERDVDGYIIFVED